MEVMVRSVLRWCFILSGGVLIGLAAASLSLKNDPRFISFIETQIIEELAPGLACPFTAKLASLNPFMGKLIFTDVSAHDHDNQWSWRSDRVVVRFSWLRALIFGTFRLVVTVYNPNVSTLVTAQGPALSAHCARWASLPKGSLPIVLESLHIVRAHGDLYGQEPSLRAEFTGNGNLTVLISSVQITASWYGATIDMHDRSIMEGGSGSLQGRIMYDAHSGKLIPLFNLSAIAPLVSESGKSFPLLVRGIMAHDNTVLTIGHDQGALNLQGSWDHERLELSGYCTIDDRLRELHPALTPF